jgi:hypothetical protein
VRILVSDNSSKPEESERLAEFCARQDDERLVYVRAPESMPMGTHWNWAIGQALRAFDATHVTVHYDRKITRGGELALLARLAAKHPGMVITYRSDAIGTLPTSGRTHIVRAIGDGGLYEMDAERVLATIASGLVRDLPVAIPLLNNCLVPREVLAGVTDRFGDICDSVAADVSFGFRFLGMYDRYLHFNRGIGVLHTFARSHAVGFLTGKDSDLGDLRAMWGDRPWLDAAPIPGLTVGQNMLFHEYVLAQRVFGLGRFPEIDINGYLGELANSAPWISDPVKREEALATLVRHGWTPPSKSRTVRALLGRVRRALGGLWRRFSAVLGIRVSRAISAPFPSEAEALKVAVASPAPLVRRCALMTRMDARQVASE